MILVLVRLILWFEAGDAEINAAVSMCFVSETSFAVLQVSEMQRNANGLDS